MTRHCDLPGSGKIADAKPLWYDHEIQLQIYNKIN